jgi:hypothetical protein
MPQLWNPTGLLLLLLVQKLVLGISAVARIIKDLPFVLLASHAKFNLLMITSGMTNACLHRLIQMNYKHTHNAVA